MANYLDEDLLRDWIGLKTLDGYRIEEVKPVGAHNVVYVASLGNSKIVLKIPRTHIGFVINLPPNGIFYTGNSPKAPITENLPPVLQGITDYDKVLNTRLSLLHGSPLFSYMLPFEVVWQRIAVELLKNRYFARRFHLPKFLRFGKGARKNEPSVEQLEKLKDVNHLINSTFVLERLEDWASIDATNKPHELVVIHAGDEPIHANTPEFLAREAKQAIDNFDSICNQVSANKITVNLENNPFLPYIAAIITNYKLSPKSTENLVNKLEAQNEMSEHLRQLGQILHMLTPILSSKIKAHIIGFIGAVAINSSLESEEVSYCLDKLNAELNPDWYRNEGIVPAYKIM